MQARKLTDLDLIEQLRRAASVWFKNDDLLLLEELIRRYHMREQSAKPNNTPVK